MSTDKIYDMVIIGAGLSGIGAACRFRTKFPEDSLALIETRDAIGGTWDLFRYPGIRSDSDMLTLGYDFRPWVGDKTLADGPSIKRYVETVAEEYGITPYIQFGSKVTSLDFSSDDDVWTVNISDVKTGDMRRIQTRFITSAAGYYKYEEGYTPEFKGRDDFKGEIVHPQHWTEGLDYSDKKIVVIGSGATAVTLVPELAKTAGHVTMLQRSPSYVASIPSKDTIGNFFRRILPAKTAFKINRAKNIWISKYMYEKARKNPEKTKEWFRKKILKSLGKDYPVDKHFSPKYDPWDQRVCMIPDEDMFIAIREGRASVETDHIEKFTSDGILLKSGETLKADIIVTATGLNVVFNGQSDLSIDGEPISVSDSFGYKGIMYSGVPNLVSVFGYTNASWTLRADLISQFAVRVITHMKEKGFTRAVPLAPEGMPRRPYLDFQAGYLQRVFDELPSQGDRHPWQNLQNYKMDQKLMLEDPIEDGALTFSKLNPVKMAAE
ncbi:flavin-containing monooxygenase [Hellea balneolensis]|uniref:flavin-containing monooxygenase n=1 Tax=Hellea balneolensis TaxID=287478 RepID=UPI0003FDD6FE|nr:NAD(P)/FAD-dependent oxidoreductase [Hellea balneolensis]